MKSFLILFFSVIVSFQAFSQELETRLETLRAEKAQLENSIAQTEREVATLERLKSRIGQSYTSTFANLAYIILRETCDITNLLCGITVQSETQLNNLLIAKYTALSSLRTRAIIVINNISQIQIQILARDVNEETTRIERVASELAEVERQQTENQRRIEQIDRSLSQTERMARRALREARNLE